MRWKRLCVMLGTFVILTNCSEQQAGSETSREILRAWEETLPSASPRDTEQTRREVAVNRLAFVSLCKKLEVCDGRS